MSFPISTAPRWVGATDRALPGTPVADPGMVELVSRLTVDGRILDISSSSRDVLGFAPEALVGLCMRDLLHPEDAVSFLGSVAWPRAVRDDRTTIRVRHRQGHWVWLDAVLVHDAMGGPSEITVRGLDVTGCLGGAGQVDQVARLESLGRLAAGLAHEINSPIQFVGDNARFLASAYQDLLHVLQTYRELLASDSPTAWEERRALVAAIEDRVELEYLESEVPHAAAQTLEGIGRVSAIVRAMKTFSHPGDSEQVPADINEALVAAATVARHRVDSVAELVMELADLPAVRCYIADLNQVFLNLIVNAADAVAETGVPGTITVRTVLEGGDVLVSVSDTGTGISDDVRVRMFDPFFTTKDVGQGSGQGLALVHAVVHAGHGGTVSVDSTVGAGSSFTVRLPVDGIAHPLQREP